MRNINKKLMRKFIGDKNYLSMNSTPEIRKVISESNYSTNGESFIVIKNIDNCEVVLNSNTTNHTFIKALTKVTIVPDNNKIDELYDEILIDRGACVEFYLVEDVWYISSSDGLKLE
jgi:hypothetical protein